MTCCCLRPLWLCYRLQHVELECGGEGKPELLDAGRVLRLRWEVKVLVSVMDCVMCLACCQTVMPLYPIVAMLWHGLCSFCHAAEQTVRVSFLDKLLCC